MLTSDVDELERQVKEAQETVKQLRRMAPASIHDAAGVQLASLSKDFEDVLATGVVDKSVPVRVRVPSDLCSSMMASFYFKLRKLTSASQPFATLPRRLNALTRSVEC